jgi:hypothetical protein
MNECKVCLGARWPGGLSHTPSKSSVVVCGILYHQYVDPRLKGQF